MHMCMYIYIIVYDCIWLYMIVYDCIWLYIYIWLYMIVYDCIYIYIMIVYDCIYDCIWLCMIVYVLHVYSMYTYMAFFQHVCLYNFEMGNFRKRQQHDPSEFHRFHDVFFGIWLGDHPSYWLWWMILWTEQDHGKSFPCKLGQVAITYWLVVEVEPYPSEISWSESQLGWWNSQLNGKIKHVPNHQPA